MADFSKLTEAVVAGDSETAVKLTKEAMAEKVAARRYWARGSYPAWR